MPTLTLSRTTSDDPGFRPLIRLLDQELRQRYGNMQDTYDGFNKIDFIDTVVIARLDGEPVGCGCFREVEDAPDGRTTENGLRAEGSRTAEIKRMFVQPDKRNAGIAAALMAELESWAQELEFRHLVLETADRQPEAIHLYKKKGYVVIDNYGPYIGLEQSICMKKTI